MPLVEFRKHHGSVFLLLRCLCIVCSCCTNVSSAAKPTYSSQDTHAAFATLSKLPSQTLLEVHSQLQQRRRGKDDVSHPSLRRGDEFDVGLDTTAQDTAPQSSHGGRSLLQFYITGQTGLWDVKKRAVGIPDDARVPRSFHSQLFGSFSRNLTRTLAAPSTKATGDVAGNYSLPPAQELAVHEGFAPKQGFGPMSPSCETMLDKYLSMCMGKVYTLPSLPSDPKATARDQEFRTAIMHPGEYRRQAPYKLPDS